MNRRIRRLGVLGIVWLVVLTTLPLTPAGAATGGWSTSGPSIVTPGGTTFVISGINWYGFETTSYVAHGLYSQDYPSIVGAIKQYGYNTIRIPFSNQMWESDPVPGRSRVSACPACQGLHSRDILALIVNYAGSQGIHVILDNHRSEAGNSAESNGLWYASGKGKSYPEASWIADWQGAQRWAHGVKQAQGSTDTITVNYLASDGLPIVLGHDLRNEPHTPSSTAYLQGATWGTGDGFDPSVNPNPNPFAPSCVAGSTCHDWRLAAERAADTLLGDAAVNGWSYPLIFVEGIGQYPTASGTPANGPYDFYWWGGELLGVNGNANNPGAPILLNAGGSPSGLGVAVTNQLVYSAHDYGPTQFQQGWFNGSTCYRTDCSSSSLSDVWATHWAGLNLANGVHPLGPNGTAFPWPSGQSYSQTPIYLGEFGTGNGSGDLYTSGNGSQGQWFTDLVNFLQSSYVPTPTNSSGYAVQSLNWTYWALNTEDSDALLGTGYTGLANPNKEYSFLCAAQQGPVAVPPGSGSGQCGSTGNLPAPN
jgi:aryl-phospho-beta-D-glucosidase BglC (GH1 family)